MHPDRCCRVRVRNGRLVVNAYILLCIYVFVSKGNAFSVIVQNGTFEVGSLDAQIAIKIRPKPDTVEKVTWYHCTSTDACSKFYVIDNVEHVAKRRGDLGIRTSHVVMHNGPEYMIYLVILQPTDGDQGEYRCQVQVADEVHLLQGRMELTKLEALRGTTEENITVGMDAPMVSMVIRMSPSNVTVYWIKCFHSVTPEPSAHFYTYDKNLNKVIASGNLGTRTSHRFDAWKHELLFSLIIQRPGLGDAGPYCCQVDAVGMMEPRLVVMWLEIVPTVIAKEFVTNSILTSQQGELDPKWHPFVAVVVTLSVECLVLLLIMICFAWKKKNLWEKNMLLLA